MAHPAGSYDRIAAEYAQAFADELAHKPFDRAQLDEFGHLAGGLVLDVGCGPGQAARQLAAAGLDVVGIDRSEAMARIGHRRCHDVRFVVGDMTALPFPAAAAGAVCSWYSMVHTPADELPALFGEFGRVLTAGGWLLLAFQTGAPPLEFTQAFGHDVNLRFLRHDIDHVLTTLVDAGFVAHRHTVRPQNADLGETADQAFVIARSGSGHATGQLAAPARNTDADASSIGSA